MLAPADASIVSRERQMPALGILLDEERFVESLRELMAGAPIEDAQARYVRYKPATSCLVAYVLRSGGMEIPCYAQCHDIRRRSKATGAVRRRIHPSVLGEGVVVDEDRAMAVHIFPNDHEIRAMRIFDPERLGQRLRRIMGGREEFREGTLHILRYKPERRVVARVDLRERARGVLRLYPESAFEEARSRAWAFVGRGVLRVPRVVGDSHRYCSIVHEWIDGEALGRMLRDSATLELTGRALAELHAQRPPLHAMLTPEDTCRLLEGSAIGAVTLAPTLTPRVRALCDRLCGAIMDHPWQSRAIHGDFSDDQVICSDGSCAIVDYDRACWGDPLLDLGSFGASLIARRVRGEIDSGLAHGALSAVARAYHARSGIDLRSLGMFVSASLLRLLNEPFRLRRPGWEDEMERLLEHAERLAAQPEAVDA